MKIKNEIDIFTPDGKTKEEKVIANEMKKFLSKRLAFYRKRSEFTQERFSEEVDISANFYARLENARNFPSSDVLGTICKSLDVSAYDLLQSSEESEPLSSSEAFEILSSKSEHQLDTLMKILLYYRSFFCKEDMPSDTPEGVSANESN